MTRVAVTRPPDPAPTEVAADLGRLGEALEQHVPRKRDDNLLIGTWNLRALSDVSRKWQTVGRDRPKRDWHALTCIAAVVGRFDVTAIQEARRDTTALFALMTELGPRYRMIVSDVTEGSGGNGERLTFVYDSERVQPSGLVGEIVLPPRMDGGVEQQFARTPYAAGFSSHGTDFVLTTVHVLWGRSPEDRLPEITAFARWMRTWADRPTDWNHNLLILGDFNLDRLDDPLFRAFVSTGLWPPAELNGVPRTIFDDDRNRHFYDQIAWFSDPTNPSAPDRLEGLTYTGHGGGFDFLPYALRGRTKAQVSWRISDHYPLWVEFTL